MGKRSAVGGGWRARGTGSNGAVAGGAAGLPPRSNISASGDRTCDNGGDGIGVAGGGGGCGGGGEMGDNSGVEVACAAEDEAAAPRRAEGALGAAEGARCCLIGGGAACAGLVSNGP